MQNDNPALATTESRPQLAQDFPTAAPTGPLATEALADLEINSNCFVCGRHNASGLHVAFESNPDGIEALWIPDKATESYEGTVHGGIITAVLDEAMSKAIIARGWRAFTVSLNLRFHSRTSPGERLRVRGWIVEQRKRRILAEASLCTEAGEKRAHASATFLMPTATDVTVSNA